MEIIEVKRSQLKGYGPLSDEQVELVLNAGLTEQEYRRGLRCAGPGGVSHEYIKVVDDG